MSVENNINIGKPQVRITDAAHVRGIRQGNADGHYERARGHLDNGKSTAERSTGINPGLRNPIDPKAPNLSPA